MAALIHFPSILERGSGCGSMVPALFVIAGPVAGQCTRRNARRALIVTP
jgi:hypothetical protein